MGTGTGTGTATHNGANAELLDGLVPMLTRLKLTAMRDQLDTLVDEAARADLNLREAPAMSCAAEASSIAPSCQTEPGAQF